MFISHSILCVIGSQWRDWGVMWSVLHLFRISATVLNVMCISDLKKKKKKKKGNEQNRTHLCCLGKYCPVASSTMWMRTRGWRMLKSFFNLSVRWIRTANTSPSSGASTFSSSFSSSTAAVDASPPPSSPGCFKTTFYTSVLGLILATYWANLKSKRTMSGLE